MTPTFLRLPIPASVAVSAFFLLMTQTAAVRPADPIFEKDVQPVLQRKCGKCHSRNVRKAGLDLSSMAGIRRGGESDENLLAKELDGSHLWVMIDSREMPPEDEPQLSSAEIVLIRSWIESGASSNEPIEPAEEQLNQHDVIPIMLLRCTTCHGPQRQNGGLDLRTPTAMRKGGDSGPALIPGKPDASPIIQRIESEACPPRDLLLKFFVRRPPASEVETLRNWIAAGAPEVDVAPDVATTEPDPLVTDDDRQHWAFQPPKSDSPLNSIDAFILAKLNEHDLTFSLEADRDTLIRRAYLDLNGMPPSVAEWQKWRSNNDSNWYPQMIDHLLASPRYGERWGRYWLDLAGYANSEGGVSADPVRKVAWKYRDYVIRSFNEDKPYDRFLIEQLAGDELIDHANADEITQEMVDNLVATGFLRMGIDQTGSRTMNFVPERLGVIGDAITIVGEGLMGLTLGCARCHSHKYDPIPHRDYYRLKAIFQGAFDEHDWLTFRNRSLSVDVAERRKRVAKVNPPLARKLKKLNAELKQANSELRLQLLRSHYPSQPETDRRETLRALRIADNNRTQSQRILVEMLQSIELIPDDEQPEPVRQARDFVASLERQIRTVQKQMEPPLTIRAVWDRGSPSPTYILRRGEHTKPGRLVGPGVPSVLTDGRTRFEIEEPFPNGTAKTGRRLAFARWLTRPDHPLTSRVLVNRVWYHHFGTGLVKSIENFGVQGERPSHPELLDWLAVRFTRDRWSLKQLHRLIMNSRTYRQSSRVTAARNKLDPQNRLLSRMALRRMDAESLRDSLLFVAGALDESCGGPPDPVSVDRNGLVSVIPNDAGQWRRSIYLQFRRTEVPSIMATFDYPEMGPNCLTRSTSTVSPQSLMLLHGRHVHDLAARFAEIAHKNSGDDPQRQVQAVYQRAFSRSPTERELNLGIATLRQLREELEQPRDKALEAYCHTIFNSAAFLYID